jgi:hypothetical protein
MIRLLSSRFRLGPFQWARLAISTLGRVRIEATNTNIPPHISASRVPFLAGIPLWLGVLSFMAISVGPALRVIVCVRG